MAPYMTQAQQKWQLSAVSGAGGYPGSPFFKITIAGTERALTATAAGEVRAVDTFTGAPEQLWRIDQLADGSYRVMPKAMPDRSAPLALSAVGSSKPTLARFRPDGDRERWLFKAP
jgi:arabinan endo-1,5-alpha-L-arabinosidase